MSVPLGVLMALALLALGGALIRAVRTRHRLQYGIFRRLYWLPEPIYYWLLDRFTDNNGWRPLGYRKGESEDV